MKIALYVNETLVTELSDDKVEEIFGEEIKDEYVQTTKPAQYQTTFTEVGDGTRFRINTALKIIDGEIEDWEISDIS